MNLLEIATFAAAVIVLALVCKWADDRITRHFRIRRRLGL